ncbi:MAG: hypothetical protein KZQ83_19815 [gamma proteobacterium symbiont of Taylorina sp.]|nr:hypothetical protein [gamma proteobacterium symbiont of Taylorina sp.]
MVTFEEISQHNHKILERINIISYMIKDRTICDSDVTCDLFFDLMDRIKSQMDIEERELYKDMLTHSDHAIKTTADNFLSGAAEIRRVYKHYMKRWCHNKNLRIKNHDNFVQETDDFLDLIQLRIIDKTEKFYPVVRSVYGEKMAA